MKEKLTFTQAVELFRKHWNTIADMTPEEMEKCDGLMDIKGRALEKIGIEENVCANCFCCEYSMMICYKCPIRWNGICNTCVSGDGEYANFAKEFESGEYGQAAEIARKIANLPAREMMEGEE